MKCESSHPETTGSEPLGRGWAAEADFQLTFWYSALPVPMLDMGSPVGSAVLDLAGDRVEWWVEFEAGGPQAPPQGRAPCREPCLHVALVTGALFFVSQGSWVRSSFHLQPRMIG